MGNRAENQEANKRTLEKLANMNAQNQELPEIVLNQTQTEERNESVLCYDGERQLFYLSELNNGRILILTDPDLKVKKRAQEEYKQMHEYLLNPKKLTYFSHKIADPTKALEVETNPKTVQFKWSSQVYDFYRRRKLPVYFLFPDRMKYPVFYSKDDIAMAFLVRTTDPDSGKEQLSTMVNCTARLENYSDLLEKPGKGSFMKKRIKNASQEFMIEVELSLLASVNKNIHLIINEAYFKYGIELRKKSPEMYLALKINGRLEYLYGDMPLINYFVVQDCIRHNLVLDVLVTEVPIEGTEHPDFPCIVSMEERAGIEEFNKEFNWAIQEHAPIIYWSLPRDINGFINKEGMMSRFMGFKKNFVVPKMSEYFCKPRALLYPDGIEFNTIRSVLAKDIKLPLVVSRLYSGEVLFIFRMKILGVSNISSLFCFYDNDFYYNGFRIPSYVSHYRFKQIDKEGQKRIIAYQAPLLKLNESGSIAKNVEIKHPGQFLDLDKLDYTTKGSMMLEDMRRYFGLPFRPYLLVVETYAFAGSRLLESKKTSIPVPFCNNPRFDFPIKFESLKVCDLAMETRMAFILKMIAVDGESLDIGSASINLFDMDGRLTSGFQEIALWPFTTIESIMTGTTQFVGRVDEIRRDSSLSKIEVQFDTYATEVFYTLKDEVLFGELLLTSTEEKDPEKKGTNKQGLSGMATTEELVRVKTIIKRDPVNLELSDEEKKLILKCQSYLKEIPDTLIFYLTAIKWYVWCHQGPSRAKSKT